MGEGQRGLEDCGEVGRTGPEVVTAFDRDQLDRAAGSA